MNINNARESVQAKDSNLAGSEFLNVNLAETRFNNVNLQRTSFVNINLSEVSFSDVNLTNACITAANTTGMTINDVAVSDLLHAACGHTGNFKDVMPVLRVADLQRAIDWYTGTLGFVLLWRSPNDGGGENCVLREGSVKLMLSTGAHLGDKPVFTGTLYFNTPGVAAFYDRIREKVEMVWPLQKMEYGTTEFGIRDPDGYVLAFAQAMR
ncbi:MAG: VOC family protein [Pseudomonadota bacterium]